jgi:hypothetical protein
MQQNDKRPSASGADMKLPAVNVYPVRFSDFAA